MSNKVMIDSSLLIEYIKNTKTILLDSLLKNDSITCCINETVLSEFLFYHLKVSTNKAPVTSKEAKRIAEVLAAQKDYLIIHLFDFLPGDNSMFKLVPSLMMQYNLLSNDAIILATCKIHGITQLASHDKDFEEPCKGEGISLLTED